MYETISKKVCIKRNLYKGRLLNIYLDIFIYIYVLEHVADLIELFYKSNYKMI